MGLKRSMKRVLIVNYQFLQSNNTASLRMRGLTKHLSEFDWQPVVLTARTQNSQEYESDQIIAIEHEDSLRLWKRYLNLDQERTVNELISLRKEKHKNRFSTQFVRLAEEIISYPDPMKSWYKPALENALRYISKEDVAAIISTSFPPTAHLIASEISKRKSIPWIADFRDLWTQNHYYSYSPARKLIERNLEIKTIQNADAIVTVSQSLAIELSKLHRNKKVITIENGFDIDEENPGNHSV